MEFVSIFTAGARNLWSVVYPENKENVFEIIFNNWNDTEFLIEFFTQNEKELSDPFWQGLSIDQAVNQVLDEAEEFESRLWSIATSQPGWETSKLKDVLSHYMAICTH